MAVLERPPQATVIEPLVSVRAVAEALAVAPKTVYRLVEDGELETVRVRGALRFEPRVIRHYIERRRA
jgi:excisionase family DNA binding protein